MKPRIGNIVNGNLILKDKGYTELPENLQVSRNLYLGTNKIANIPKHLKSKVV